MKHLLFIFVFLIPFYASAECLLKNELNGQKHFSCKAPGTNKSFHVLDLKGGYAETAYYHGYFLKNEIDTGVLKGIIVRTERAFAELSAKELEQIQLIRKCVINNYRASVSEEFKNGLVNLYAGYKAGGGTTPWKTFEEANYMVEFSIFADSMQRQLAENPTKGKLKVFGSCAPYIIGKALLSPFKKLAEGLRSLKMGCTGISAAASFTGSDLVHGRNFDTGLLSFYEPEQVVIINRQRSGLNAVGLASPGLHYAGGISGFNNYGISVSLHELQTEGTKIRYADGTSDVAPYLLHKVLLTARTLDDAIHIIKTRKGFGAWTFFVSDSKSDEQASIELSGDTVVVARRAKNKYLAQSNHFVAAETSAEGYEYSLNKTLETRARFKHVSRTLEENQGRIDAQWVIDRLTGHYDELVGPRAFGRTTTKLYTAATHVIVPGRQEWWMSVAETYPTNRSHFVGLRLGAGGSTPVEFIGVTKAYEEPGKELWYDSMKYYVQSYLSNEHDHKTIAGLDRTLGLLEQARAKSLENDIYEYTYEFMWARIKVLRAAKNIMNKNRTAALQDLTQAQDNFKKIFENVPSLHAYEKFQVHMWIFRAESLKSQKLQNATTLNFHRTQALGILKTLIQQYPRQSELYDLEWSLNQSEQLYTVLGAGIRLGTVE
ncbi:carcinine hydrolase/isopenicillin-N N-acyltransferase family protein [Bdellovibrio reynosensis]|uniref:Carcinine hydrolase/isopenicillin-N N-acyltransferase family protein n=1 Tax=Bdellovibrio reynosensis TaxID=2835041 RepID=A0ABY4CE42_9BACT|nr:carcinine hydrolase/isopenicillin-N N-acyltransferase family protein [Bdellovibrio reynosensis]UOF02021.1 carcinine hydrolase/isopenicillin-N N-acyltransferase family protein [Bdellovibrio reynosensis]